MPGQGHRSKENGLVHQPVWRGRRPCLHQPWGGNPAERGQIVRPADKHAEQKRKFLRRRVQTNSVFKLQGGRDRGETHPRPKLASPSSCGSFLPLAWEVGASPGATTPSAVAPVPLLPPGLRCPGSFPITRAREIWCLHEMLQLVKAVQLGPS